MTDSHGTWDSTYHLIIPHPVEPKVLLRHQEQEWSLPQFKTERPQWREGVSQISQGLQEQLGVYVTALRQIYRQVDEDKRKLETIYVMENHSPRWQPPDGTRWIGQQELQEISIALPKHRQLLENYLREVESGHIPEQRPAWSRDGWIRNAITWTTEQLERLGYPITGPIEQSRIWPLSCLLRAPTAGCQRGL